MSKNLNMTVVLDLSTMVLSPGPRMTALRFNCATAILDATRLFVTGGTYGANSNTYLKTTEMLDFDTITFTPGPHMTEERLRNSDARRDAVLRRRRDERGRQQHIPKDDWNARLRHKDSHAGAAHDRGAAGPRSGGARRRGPLSGGWMRSLEVQSGRRQRC